MKQMRHVLAVSMLLAASGAFAQMTAPASPTDPARGGAIIRPGDPVGSPTDAERAAEQRAAEQRAAERAAEQRASERRPRDVDRVSQYDARRWDRTAPPSAGTSMGAAPSGNSGNTQGNRSGPAAPIPPGTATQ
ncbi:MAG TPA: hypothetical protein PKA20_20295 [Burkholderiaceae bacterium]|nr:hypothetical protein [Burkholderiaceae bacterium]